MKRIIVLFVSLIMFFSFFSFPFSAATTATISVSSVEGKRGDLVDVSVRISSGTQMQACDFELLYNPSVVEVISAVKGSSLPSSPIINTSRLGKVVYSYASTSATTSSTALLNVQFKIKDSANYGESAITLNMKDLSTGSFAPIENTVKNGKVTVLAPKLEAPFDFETVSVDSDSCRILWSAVDDATGYNVYLNGRLVNDYPVADNMYTFDDLIADTDYTVQVTAMNYTVESDKSSEYSIHTNKAKIIVTFFYIIDTADSQAFTFHEEEIDSGETVEPPTIPEANGLKFIGWDKPLTNITEPVVITAQYEAADLPAILLGDADGDGEITIFDTTWIQRALVGFQLPSTFNEAAADVDGDGSMTVFDATFIQRHLVNLSVPYKIGEIIYR